MINSRGGLTAETMADVFGPEIRSRVMRSIRSRGNRSTEIWLASLLRSSGIRGWRRHRRVAGSIPDFVFSHRRLAIFVDGCFWHGCPLHSHASSSNTGYWIPKLAGNRARDRAATARLRRAGWRVIRLWEHDLGEGRRSIRRIKAALAASVRDMFRFSLPKIVLGR